MIVKNLEGPVYHRKRRQGLAGRGAQSPALADSKSFDQYLLEAFQGEVVQEGKLFSTTLSDLARENLIRLSKI